MRNWFLGAFIFAVTGCGWFGNEEMVGRLETGSSKLTQVPDGLVEILRENPGLSAELRSWYRVPG